MIATPRHHESWAWLAEGSPELARSIRTSPLRDHGWLRFVTRLQDWLVDPTATVGEDGDPPVDASVIEWALNAAISLYSLGAVAPTAVCPSGEGGVAFELHAPPAVGSDEHRHVVSIRFQPGRRVELIQIGSDGRVVLDEVLDV